MNQLGNTFKFKIWEYCWKNFKNQKIMTKKNEILVGFTNSGLRDLKEEIEDMSEQEKETENPNEIVEIVEYIFDFNR